MPDSLMTPAALRAALLHLMPDWAPEDVGRFEYFSGGYSNRNYRVDRGGESYVLRIPERTRPFVDRAREEAFYGLSHGLRVAELIAFDRTTGNMLTRYEPGRLLTDAPAPLDALAEYLSRLHAALPASGRAYDPIALAREYLTAGSPPRWITDLARTLDWQPAEVAPCHNDLNPWNVIRPESGPWVTLDWEWHGENDPLFDVVTLHQGLAMGDDSIASLVELWSGAAADQERLNDCLIAFWLREYAWAHAEIEHGNRRQEIRAQLDTAAAKLRRLT